MIKVTSRHQDLPMTFETHINFEIDELTMMYLVPIFKNSRWWSRCLGIWLIVLPSLVVSFLFQQPNQAVRSWTGFFAENLGTTREPLEVMVVKEMPPPLPPLHNHYYLLRHGQSTANVAGIISSSRSLAYSTRHGLTDLGYQQGKRAASALTDLVQETISSLPSESSNQPQQLIFVSSPFARAHQTAQACLEELLTDPSLKSRMKEFGLIVSSDIVLEDELVERYFGRLDGDPLFTYAYVWPVDRLNVSHTAFGVESVAAVSTRFHSLLQRLEERYNNAHVVLVSHADVIQIAQLYAAGADNVGAFSSYRFQNGEVRAMRRTVDSLPKPMPLPPLQRGTTV